MRSFSGALWGYGFRPFFLAAGVLAMLLVPWWAGALAWGVPLGTPWPPSLWHAHEMLFGFICAAIAGFLLTAVPSWTGARGFAGWPLVTLAGAWALGRIVVSSASLWPLPVVAAIDLIFLPGLTSLVLPPLARSRNRNTVLLAVLAALWVVDALFYRGLAVGDTALARHALLVGIDVVLLLVTVIGGRIVPAFTASALRQHGDTTPLRAWRLMTPLAVGAMLAVVAIDAVSPESTAAGVIALVAAAVQAARLAQWRSFATLRMPIVWVLHLAYLWLPLGFALKALALLGSYTIGAFYLHALTIGAATSMIVAVMTRASLGHTGRALVVAPRIAVAYVLLAAAAVVRVLGPAILPMPYTGSILLAAALWVAAFAIFLWVYAPILVSPRADSKPG
jgi:uncharacterized protein involved in response to NO